MQIPQTSYSEFSAALLNGMPTKNGPHKIESRFAHNAVQVGAFCVMGPSDDQCQSIASGAASLDGTLLGAAIMLTNRSPYSTAVATDSGSGQYSDGDDVSVMSKGELGMYCENAATEGHPVYVRTTAAGSSVIGQIRDGAAANFVLHPTAKFKSSSSAAGVVKVEF